LLTFETAPFFCEYPVYDIISVNVSRGRSVGKVLQAELSGEGLPAGAIFSAPIQQGPGDQPLPVPWVPVLFPGCRATGAWG
jgi:hypothetical protein